MNTPVRRLLVGALTIGALATQAQAQVKTLPDPSKATPGQIKAL